MSKFKAVKLIPFSSNILMSSGEGILNSKYCIVLFLYIVPCIHIQLDDSCTPQLAPHGGNEMDNLSTLH